MKLKSIEKESAKFYPDSPFLRLQFCLGYLENKGKLNESFKNSPQYDFGKFYATTKEVKSAKKSKRRPG